MGASSQGERAISKRSRPLVGAAADALRALIREGRYRAGDVLDSEHRLAETLRVSRGTVRLAIDILVGTGELTRRPHSRPLVGMSRERSGGDRLEVYVWVSHPISDHASLMFIRGVSLGLKGSPYRMIVREPTRFFGDHVKLDEQQFLVDLMANPGVAGAIVHRDPFAANGRDFANLQESGTPIVFVDSPPPSGVEADHVGSANLSAARACVEHLIEQGHRQIACLVESDFGEVAQQRIAGYWRAMRQAGLAEKGACLVAGDLAPSTGGLPPSGRFSARCATHGAYLDWARRLAAATLALPERPTALFVGCDVLAHSVGALLEGAGVRIPDDVSLVGFDWLARWDPSSIDDLTTASQDFEGFGRHAADLLLDRMAGEAPPSPRHVLLPAPLIVRSSTATGRVSGPSLDVPGNDALLKP